MSRLALACTLPALAASAHAQAPPFTVLLDPAHGGPDTGTLLSARLIEKDLVLDLSIRLRSALNARGIRVLATRGGDRDADPDPDARAELANHARPAACLVLHATAAGSGAHLYTSSLGGVAGTQTPASWQSAQAPYLTQSLQLASAISTALGGAGVPSTLGRVRLMPMDALQCPAVTVELAPLNITEQGKQEQAPLSDPAYEQRLVNALAAALLEWRAEREGARP